MADKNETAADKAEGVARRILQKLGSKVDTRLQSSDQNALGARHISELAARVEDAIEANLKQGPRGESRIAPNQFKVLLTHEETSKLSPEYMEAVGKELTGTVREYIANRRYQTTGRIRIEVGRDVFAKTTQVKASFTDSNDEVSIARAKSQSRITVALQDSAGRMFRVELENPGPSACLGRAAGNAITVDDASISRIHCSLALKGTDQVVVADLGSANGTYVNDAMLSASEARPIASADVIRVGDVSLTVVEIS